MKVTLDGGVHIPPVSPADNAPDPKTVHAAREFEAVFLRQMLSSMVKTTKSAMGGGTGSDTYSSMAVDSLADSLAQSGGIGLADEIVKALTQGGGHTPSGGQ